MQRFIWSDLNASERQSALARPAAISDESLMDGVRDILADVKENGDAALLRLTQKFDGVRIDVLEVPKAELKAAWDALPQIDKSVIERARRNIKRFHKAQIPAPIEVETEPGVICRRESRAIKTAGLYVPGGTAPLVSTLLMLAVPAKVAGVKNRVVVTPPGKDGKVDPTILAAAYRCKVSALYVIGGAQAIGALAYGTETIPKCDKIFGPGNAWVAAAKSLVAQAAGGPAIDMPAGPSEAMVLADEAADPAFVASDLLSQAEHDTVAQVVCVASTTEVADCVEVEIAKQLETLPRKNIATESLKLGRMFIAEDRAEIIDIVNRYAPEHLIVQLRKPDTYVGAIRNAGSIFLGPWTPESVGDYASGTNHTLPTYGAARAYSGVTLESFIKYVSIQKLTKKGLKRLGPVVERLAEMEGLDAHKRAVSLRLEALQ
ncbi:histidinol dehydrogenase [Litorimonas sp. WD9-15]|uniref:histidinol dehydrogenase n=1 Tax=Litorimonas sp. WD9-15 TaxID=3418716 RepID=UPI003D0894E0